jgi:putative tricarboxylic transport membrane protein
MNFSEIAALGLSVSLQPVNLLYAFGGVLIGTVVGVLPGLGPAATLSLLLPISFQMTPTGAIILLAGIYYGCMYGGSTTSILINVPGEAASVVTCLDGYQMALQGRAGPALGIAAIGSFIAGTVGTLLVMLVSPLLANVALRFGPPEFTSLIIMSFMVLTYIVKGSMVKGLMMASIGVFLSTVGLDPVSGSNRFTYNILELMDGIGFPAVIMGLFGISEVLINLEASETRNILRTKIKNIVPTIKDLKSSVAPIFRGSILGFFIGIIPGGGTVLASFMSYGIEKKVSKNPDKFGTGVIEGVAGPEAANNAAAIGHMVPLLSLGIPTSPVIAILLGALMMHGIDPGPMLMVKHADLFWGVIFSMYVGNVMLLMLNLPLVGLWVQFLRIPYSMLFPLILLFCLIGAYSIANSVVDVFIMLLFGVLGYLFRKTDYEGAPLILGLVLGSIFENAFRQSLMLSDGSFLIFFYRPISLLFIVIAIILLVIPIIGWFKKGTSSAQGTSFRMRP